MDMTLRPMSTSQVLDKTFNLYRQNFLLFVGIATLPQICLLVARLLLLLSQKAAAGEPGAMLAAALIGLLAGVGLAVLALVSYALSAGASVHAVSRLHLGYATSISEAYRLVRPYIWSITGIVFLVGLIVFAVLIVLAIAAVAVLFAGGGLRARPSAAMILPLLAAGLAGVFLVIYISAKFALAIPACVLERLGTRDSMQRSLALTRGSILRVVLVNILAFVVSFALSAVLSIPYYIGLARAFGSKDLSTLAPYVAWQYVADFISGSLAAPIATIAVTLVYYDERVRKEGFDLQWMMENLGPPSPQPPAPPAAPLPAAG